ncbi:MAG: NifU family protein [Pseudomonadota bacterium]|nr:NifU family protein [Pseudomonadota bacterium]
MFIQTEDTPNPLTLKLVPGREVMGEGAREFSSAYEARQSPLAEALFDIDGVTGVFFGPDFLTVSKAFGVDWKTIRAPILAAVMDFYGSGQPLFSGDAAQVGHAEDDYEGDAAAIVAEIKDLLDTRIRPAVAQDGGDITFSRFEPDTGVVWLHMRGACAGCPSSAMTLKAGVENMLRHYVPEVTAVEQTL